MSEFRYVRINKKVLIDLVKDLDPRGYNRLKLLACVQELSRLHGGYIYATGEKLAEATGINKKTVQRLMLDFEKDKFIVRVAPGVWQFVDQSLPRMIDLIR